MEFTSLYFIVLVIVSAHVYYLLNSGYRSWFLALLSACFVASLNVYLLAYVLVYTAVNYFFGIKIENDRTNKTNYRLALGFNIVQIIILNYAAFAIDPFLKLIEANFNVASLSKIIVPLGISYYTLQSIGYLVNVKMNWEKAETSYIDLFLYLSFFPKFLSGPVERSNHFLPQLKDKVSFRRDNFVYGLRRILLGLFKKLLIANHLSPFIYSIYAQSNEASAGYVWLLILVQPLYLYFDFSGYTDIAVGMARLFGINLLENFKRPFFARNITTFWKRFHISLSSWLSDYMFKQTTFRYRKLKDGAVILSMFLTWTIFGIWHGAGWNFMILGVVLAISIIWEYYTRRQRSFVLNKLPVFLSKLMGRAFTYIFYGLALILFFATNTEVSANLYTKLLKFGISHDLSIPYMPLYIGLAIALLFLIVEYIEEEHIAIHDRLMSLWTRSKVFRYITYYVMLILVVSEMGNDSGFVYEMF